MSLSIVFVVDLSNKSLPIKQICQTSALNFHVNCETKPVFWPQGTDHILFSILQIDVSYNVPDPVAKPAFQLKVDLKEPKQEQHILPSSRHMSTRTRSRADNRSELTRKRRAPVDDEDPAGHQDHLDYRVTLEVCTR